ncbi:MAG TPA: hypothetical protein VFP60_07395 [Pseudolabrys sp.]|nr:hypothetical protein [Pseudolabrys sp.]
MMRWLVAILLILVGRSAVQAEIRIDESRYVDGTLIISGQTAPNRTVTLDGKYKTKSDGGGHFKFTEHYKPFTCMSDIRSGEDVYSPVIAGCLLADSATQKNKTATDQK